jgi:REP element-mobilizing transposase RayT
LLLAPPVLSPSQIAQFLKGESSKWIHEEFQRLRDFAWQDGYGAFTISKSQVPQVIRYIQNQREHHRMQTFQEEYRQFLKLHGIEYDERYVWG